MAQDNQRRRDNARGPSLAGEATRLQLIETAGFADYALLDSGAGRKLERFGPIVVDRPEPQALWTPAAPEREWRHAHAVFSGDDEEDKGRWRIDKPVPESWPVKVGAATVLCRLASFRHMGLFPEQMPHWEWMLAAAGREARRAAARAQPVRLHGRRVADGGGGRRGGHARRRFEEGDRLGEGEPGGLGAGRCADPLDARRRAKFVAREVRRGKTYDVILVDPPKFGRGPDGEVWDLFTSLPPLMKDCAALLAPGAALVLTVYAIRASSLAFDQLCREVLAGRGGTFQSGELAIRETGGSPRRAGVALHPLERLMNVAPKAITSLQNDRVKAIRALDMRKERKETGLFVAEGASLLVTARDNGFVPQTLVYRAGSAGSGIAQGLVAWALAAGVECLEVSEAVLGKLASKDNPQSMLGVFKQRWVEPPAAAKVARDDVWVALEEVRDPGNLGTIIRTADAVGAGGVILIGTSCDPYSHECVRATMGSIFAVPLVRMTREAFLGWVKNCRATSSARTSMRTRISARRSIARPRCC